jgi:hypothetical protein
LHRRGIRFRTRRRRTRPRLGRSWSLPASAWRRITWSSLTRALRAPRVLDERVQLPGDTGAVRQSTVLDLGPEAPTTLLTNNLRSGCATPVTRSAQRRLIEDGIAEAIPFFPREARSSMVGLKGDFALQSTLRARARYRLRASRVGREYQHATAKKIFRNLLDVSATVEILEHAVVVTVAKRAQNPSRVASRLADEPTPMPWFGDKPLAIRFS